jgi:hypothetical protein
MNPVSSLTIPRSLSYLRLFMQCSHVHALVMKVLLLGAIVSNTNPVSVVTLLKEMGIPTPIITAINAESMMNATTSVVLYVDPPLLVYSDVTVSTVLCSALFFFFCSVMNGKIRDANKMRTIFVFVFLVRLVLSHYDSTSFVSHLSVCNKHTRIQGELLFTVIGPTLTFSFITNAQ